MVYINGKKCGLGKEYNEFEEIEFEGEYFDDKKWNGKGIEYNNNGEYEFEGVYFEGKRWNGILKEYDYTDDTLIFEGEIVNGKKMEFQ